MTKILALTQGDPAGIGPEILLKALSSLQDLSSREASSESPCSWRPLLIAEAAALHVLHGVVDFRWESLVELHELPSREHVAAMPDDAVALVDPVGAVRKVVPGRPGAEDARGALAALDLGIDAVQSGLADALVTAPLSKSVIAQHVLPGFVGHTDYLAARSGLQRYGRDYLMTFLAPDLRVALLSTHIPLAQAIQAVTPAAVDEALACLHRHGARRIALAGLNPHAGEGGLLGAEDEEILRPATQRARSAGIDVRGPESPDTVFQRARRGEFDWVLALYHDQGLIAVKTAAFGSTVHQTLGLPFLRVSVDHGTAFDLAGRGLADEGPMLAVLRGALDMLV